MYVVVVVVSQPTSPSRTSHALRSRTRGWPNLARIPADSADSHRHALQPFLLPPCCRSTCGAGVPPCPAQCPRLTSHWSGPISYPARPLPRLSRAGSARGPLYLRPTRRPGMQIEHQHQSTIVLSHNTSPLRPTSLFGSPPSSLTSLFAWLEVNANPESDLRDVREMTVDQRLPGHWRLRWRWWCGGWRRWHNGWRHPR